MAETLDLTKEESADLYSTLAGFDIPKLRGLFATLGRIEDIRGDRQVSRRYDRPWRA